MIGLIGFAVIVFAMILFFTSIGACYGDDIIALFMICCVGVVFGIVFIVFEATSPVKVTETKVEYVCTDSLNSIKYEKEHILEKTTTIKKATRPFCNMKDGTDVKYKMIKKLEDGDLNKFKPLTRF